MAYNKLEYDQQMKDAMRQQLASTQPEKPEDTQETTPPEQTTEQATTSGTENEQKFQENNQSSDITPSDNESAESTEDPIENLLNKTFGGDPKKATKSYLESQKAYAKLQEQARENEKKLRELEGQFSTLDQVISNNPDLLQQLEKAIKGGNESQSSSVEPHGKPNQNVDAGKLSSSTLPTEQTLVSAGYMDASDKDNLPTMEYQQKLLSAQISYVQKELPDLITQQVEQRLTQSHQQRAEQQKRDQVKQTNTKRLSEGFDRAVAKFGLDFTGAHATLFDEINNTVLAYRDPNNLDLVDEQAVELAAERVLKQHNMLPSNTSKSADTASAPVGDNGFNSNKPASVQPKSNDFSSKFHERLNALNIEQIQRRNQNRRTLSS